MEEKTKHKTDLSIIVPIYNEEKVIPELYERLKAAAEQISTNFEFLFINDGSKDDSIYELQKLHAHDDRCHYINFSRNFGHQIAVSAGIDAVSGDVVVIIDGDLQDPPELIPEMYAKHKEGFEVVYAKRSHRKGESVIKKWTAKMFYRTLKNLTSVDIPVDTGDFRLIHHSVVDYLRKMPEQNKFFRGQIAWLGFRSAECLFKRDERKYGKTGYTYGKLLNMALDGITGFSDKPLQFVTKIGFLISIFSFCVIIYALFSHFVLQSPLRGWTSLIISSAFIGGVQLLSIGIIGEYLSRINKNVLQRPLYIIESSTIKKEELSES